MNNTAPKSTGMIVVAGMFGLVASGISHVMFELETSGVMIAGGTIAALVLVLLAVGWREPQK